ncbi:MAG: flavocytochrome c [Hungatella sp.]|nr:flavocytochrome c [Hungatella sp.]
MKKMAVILLSMMLLLCGCGGKGDTPTTAAETTAAETTAAEPAGDGTYKPGTYTASAQGNNGPVELSVTFSEDAITEITIGEHAETQGLSDPAFEKIPAAIVQYQSLGVDTISGATYTSNAILDAVADCVAQAGGDAEALRAVAVEGGEDTEGAVLADSEVDVLVIGGGGAGLSAALSASQGGASVILVEKLSALGGNTFRCGGAFNTADPERQKDIQMTEALSSAVEKVLAHEDVSEDHAKLKAEVQKQWDEYKASGSTALFDTPEWHALQSIDAGDYEGNVELVRTLTSNTLDTLNWLTDNGVEWTDQVSTVVGALWNRSHQTPNNSGADIIAALEQNATASGVEIYLDTKAEELIVEDGRVAGAVITNSAGDKVTVKAGKGVIMATGGFSANVEMRVKYNKQWEDIGESLATNNSPGATGDGIVMGEAVGANLVGMGWIQLMPLNGVSGGGISGYVNSSLYCNKEGKRFVAEDQRRDVLAAAVLAQTDKLFYIVCDQKEAELRGLTPEVLSYMVDNGLLYSGETIAELAENMGVPADALEQTVKEFNEAVKADKPDEFGRTTWENTIETGPFYAPSFSPAVHHTMGGLEINGNAEVINTDGEVIPGFYAAGEVTGGIHGTNRVGGNAVPDALCFGKIAGANAAKN